MTFEQEQRHVYYDTDLKIEAYHLTGIVQPFPNHFHDYYVIGFVEGGRRHLWCKDREYDLSAGDLVLFNPRDSHRCSPRNGEILDYRAVNIPVEVMQNAALEITGQSYTPFFTQNVVYQSDITGALNDLYTGIVELSSRFEKEEAFFFLLEQIFREYSSPFEHCNIVEPDNKIKSVCTYMEDHFSENISLDDLTVIAGLSKSYFLLLFTKQIGVSPYRYLQSIRIERAKKLLEQGVPAIDTAAMTGFSDQSHFSRFFKEFIGLTPRQYQKIFQTESSQDLEENFIEH